MHTYLAGSPPPGAGGEPIRVIVCADNGLVLRGLQKVIEVEWPRLHLVAALRRLDDVGDFLRKHMAEVGVAAIPSATGEALGALQRLAQLFGTPFVVLTADIDAGDDLTGAGAVAALPMDAPAERILDAVYRAVGQPHEH